VDIRHTLGNLVRLAKNPGTPHEGEVAKQAAIRLSLKYGIECEFTPPAPPKNMDDMLFDRWIKALNSYGWYITDHVMTKVGRQIRFRKMGSTSEIRVTQRKNSDGRDFDAEHIRNADPINGEDWSFSSLLTVNLNTLLKHISKVPVTPMYR